MTIACLNELLKTLKDLSNGAEALDFQFVANFDVHGRLISSHQLALERNANNSVPEVTNLTFSDALMPDWCDEELYVEAKRSILKAIGPEIGSIYSALGLPEKVIGQGDGLDKRGSFECGGHLMAVLVKDSGFGGACYLKSTWNMSHDFDWKPGFQGFMASYFTRQEIVEQSSADGSICKVMIDDEA